MVKKNINKIIFFHTEFCEWCRWVDEEVWMWIKKDEKYLNWQFIDEDDDSELYSNIEDEIFFYPTLVIIKDGVEVSRIIGVQSKDEYAYRLEEMMALR